MIVLHIILYGVIAGASALAAAAVVVVLRSEHSRLHGIAFAVGFVAAQLLVILLALFIGDGSLPSTRSSHLLIEAILQILLGTALLLAAQRVRHPKHPVVARTRGPLAEKMRARQEAVLARIGAMDSGPILGAGALLGVGGPKRLLLALVTAATIATASVSTTEETALVAVYVALATVLVWVPVLLAVVWGSRAGEWTARVQTWWKDHKQTATYVPLLVFGVYFIASGVIDLARR
ncbi:MAG: GAP family protein [Acidimicrobiia bacterium]